jgi:hypothetical protein
LNEIFLAGIKGDITYEFYFDPAVWGVGSVPNLTKCNVISRHIKYGTDELTKMERRYKNLSQSFRYRDLVEQNFSKTLDPSTDYEFLTTQFTSPGSEVFVQVYKAGDKIADLVQHIESYNIKDDGGQSILSSEAMNTDYHKIILNAAHSLANVVDSTTSDPWLIIPLSPDGTDDIANGSINGFHDFNGGEQLLFKTKSTLVSGIYKVKVYYSKIRMLNITGGKIQVN